MLLKGVVVFNVLVVLVRPMKHGCPVVVLSFLFQFVVVGYTTSVDESQIRC